MRFLQLCIKPSGFLLRVKLIDWEKIPRKVPKYTVIFHCPSCIEISCWIYKSVNKKKSQRDLTILWHHLVPFGYFVPKQLFYPYYFWEDINLNYLMFPQKWIKVHWTYAEFVPDSFVRRKFKSSEKFGSSNSSRLLEEPLGKKLTWWLKHQKNPTITQCLFNSHWLAVSACRGWQQLFMVVCSCTGPLCG